MTRRALLLLVGLVAALLVVPAAPAGAAEHSVFAYGDAPFLGSTGSVPLNHAVVGMARTPSGAGYWLAARDGRVSPFGAAGAHGSIAVPDPSRDPVVAIAPTRSGEGYWITTSTGAVYTAGDAPFLGSLGAVRLNEPIVGMAATPSGGGYWLVARDGGIFTFGDAGYFGSTGAIRLNEPIAGMAPTPSGRGYWLVARDGGIFTFGDARFFGSTGAVRLVRSIVGMTATPSGGGYWLVAADGGIFTFGDARFLGSVGGGGLAEPAVGMVRSRSGNGYWIVTTGHIAPSRTANPPQRIIRPGSYRVSASGPVVPGIYRAVIATPDCQWERRGAFDGSGGSLLASVTSNDRQVVEVLGTDQSFRTTGCAPFVNELLPVTTSRTASFGDGTWIEGIDIGAGTWRSSGGDDSCVWTRVGAFTGDSSAVKATGSGAEDQTVQIDPSDAGFVSDGCGTWRRA